MASQITGVSIFSPPFVEAQKNKTSNLRVTGLCEGNPPVTGGFLSQRVTQKMLPFDDVIMMCLFTAHSHCWMMWNILMIASVEKEMSGPGYSFIDHAGMTSYLGTRIVVLYRMLSTLIKYEWLMYGILFLHLFTSSATSLGGFRPWDFCLNNGLHMWPWTASIPDLNSKLIDKSVPGLATDSPRGVWCRRWTTCFLYGGPV